MKKIIAVLLALSTVIAESGVYAATYVNGEDVTNEVFTTISNDFIHYSRCATWEKSSVAM